MQQLNAFFDYDNWWYIDSNNLFVLNTKTLRDLLTAKNIDKSSALDG